MILGFDNDDDSIFDAQREFIREARIALAMVGMLSAIPKTPLYDAARSARAGSTRTTSSAVRHQCHPARMSREAARRLCRVMSDLYEPEPISGGSTLSI